MNPTTPERMAKRAHGRRKAAMVTVTAALIGAAAAGGIGVAMAANTDTADTGTTTSTTTGDSTGSSTQSEDQLQPPATNPGSDSGTGSHSGSGAS